jgi:hypothetical protein
MNPNRARFSNPCRLKPATQAKVVKNMISCGRIRQSRCHVEMTNSDALCLQSQSTHKQRISAYTCLLLLVLSLSGIQSSSSTPNPSGIPVTNPKTTSILLSPTIFLLPISLVQGKDSRSSTGRHSRIAPEWPGQAHTTATVYDTCECKGQGREKSGTSLTYSPKLPPSLQSSTLAVLAARQRVSVRARAGAAQDPPTSFGPARRRLSRAIDCSEHQVRLGV